jgi:23S rRNA pseudouridine1911/1915/1917 synthase
MREWMVESADEGLRLDQWLAGRTEAGSRSRASQWLARGKVYVDGKPAESAARADRVMAGQRISVWMDRPGSSKPADRSVRDERHLLNVVHQDEAIVVLDKPPGLLVEPLPDRAGEESTLLDLLADHYRHERRARSYVVHRIDRDTSGLVLFARTPSARDGLKEQFEQRTPERVYQAVVLGRPMPPEGIWRDTLAWDPSSLRQRQAHGRDARGKDAEARYRVLDQFAETAVVEVSLVTGKRNQIRVQAAMRGHPLLGERQYRFGAPPEPPSLPHINRQALHAWKLGFVHPTTGRRVSYTSPLSDDIETLLRALRKRR